MTLDSGERRTFPFALPRPFDEAAVQLSKARAIADRALDPFGPTLTEVRPPRPLHLGGGPTSVVCYPYLPGMNDSAAARLQAENEALLFECEMLRREAKRLVTVNRTLEARLALAKVESDRQRSYLEAIERSRPWRLAQTLRKWLGRHW
jgi:hypothetical protein